MTAWPCVPCSRSRACEGAPVFAIAAPRDVRTAVVQLDAIAMRGQPGPGQRNAAGVVRQASRTGVRVTAGRRAPGDARRPRRPVRQAHRVEHGTRPRERAIRGSACNRAARGSCHPPCTRTHPPGRSGERNVLSNPAASPIGVAAGHHKLRAEGRNIGAPPTRDHGSGSSAASWRGVGGLRWEREEQGRPAAAYQPSVPTSWHHARVNDDLVRRMRDSSS